MILADTSIWVELLDRSGRRLTTRPRLLDLVICGPVLQEILQGVPAGPRLMILQQRLLDVPRVGDPVAVDIFLHAADIYRSGRARGYTIRGPYDCLIAAIAIENRVPVWHRDRDYTTIARYTDLQIHRPT